MNRMYKFNFGQIVKPTDRSKRDGLRIKHIGVVIREDQQFVWVIVKGTKTAKCYSKLFWEDSNSMSREEGER